MVFKNKISHSPDVLILGGGSAGVASAVGAASSGLSVVLVEKNGFLGGKATAAYVGTVCGLYFRSENTIARFVSSGFPMQFAMELMKRSTTTPIQHKNGLHFLPYNQFDFMNLCDELAVKNTDSFYLHAFAMGAGIEHDKIKFVDTMINNQPIRFFPKAVIDTSGNTVLANLLQTETIQNEQYQAASQVFVVSGFADVTYDVMNLSLIRGLKKGVEEGILLKEYAQLSIVPGSVREGRALLKLGIPLVLDNDPTSVTKVELFARTAVTELINFMKSNIDLFKNIQLVMMAPEAGTRTGPGHKGKIILNETDVMNCKKSKNAVARGAWPIEYWEPGKNVEMNYFEMDDYYDIPSGALQSDAIQNMFFGGRNISATEKAIASARVIGTCLATGYAAGKLAAGYVKGEQLTDTISSIQKDLFS